MRFQIHYDHIGDERIKKCFLIFPKRIGQEIRWFEYAEWIQEYEGEWEDLRWVN